MPKPPDLARPLLVPIQVQALCVGRADIDGQAYQPAYGTRHFAATSPAFDRQPHWRHDEPVAVGPHLGDQVAVQPFEAEPRPLGIGVHLHWSLPRRLAQGAVQPAGTRTDASTLQFPDAPDRWLVVRIVVDTSGAEPAYQAWVVESTRRWADTGEDNMTSQHTQSATLPWDPSTTLDDRPTRFRRGWVTPLAQWVDDTDEDPRNDLFERHSVVGYGVPHFAANYRDCGNVFGFWDPLEDLKSDTAQVAYLVLGWYRRLANDAVHGLVRRGRTDPQTQRDAILTELGWQVELSDGRAPNQALFHGMVQGIAWDPDRIYVEPRPESELQVAVGPTTVEALSAWLANAPHLRRWPQAEWVLNAVQTGALPALDVSGARPAARLAEVDAMWHRRQFASLAGGTVWTLQAPGPAPGGTMPPGAQIPSDWREALQGLNTAQTELDRLTREIAARRSQIYADWTHYMRLEWPTAPTASPASTAESAPPGVDPPSRLTADVVRGYVTQQITDLDALVDRWRILNSVDASDGVAYLAKQLSEQIARSEHSGWRLVERAAPRFWVPRDPVILLAGADTVPTGAPPLAPDAGDAAPLRCRQLGEVVNGLRWNVGASPLLRLPHLSGLRPPAARGLYLAMIELIEEASYLHLAESERLMRALPPEVVAQDFAEALRAAQIDMTRGELPTGPLTPLGLPPAAPAMTVWSHNPWLPWRLDWEVEHLPVAGVEAIGTVASPYPASYLRDHYRPTDDDTDLVARVQTVDSAPTGIVYQGCASLATAPDLTLRNALREYVAHHPDTPHAAELTRYLALPSLPLAAQALSGWTAALLARSQTLQLPVGDPLASLRGDAQAQFSNLSVANAVQDQNRWSPLLGRPFHPWRTGALRLRRLRLVDAFGQWRDISVDPAVVRAAVAYQWPDGHPGPVGDLALAPRLAQAARLDFRWGLGAGRIPPTGSEPARDALCGWLVFNGLDASVTLHDAQGRPLISVHQFGALLRPAVDDHLPLEADAGDAADAVAAVDARLAHASPHLRAFVESVRERTDHNQFLQGLFDAIDRAASTIHPANAAQHQTLAHLLGRPLALVRASLALELEGPPAVDPSFPALEVALRRQPPATSAADRPHAGFTDVRVSVQLGEVGNVDDGLVGYFDVAEGQDLIAGYRRFYSASGEDPDFDVAPPDPDTVQITANPRAGERQLTLLIDPRAPVHARTGILPARTLSVPDAWLADALPGLSLTLAAHPVLTPSATIHVPVPAGQHLQWDWLERGPEGIAHALPIDSGAQTPNSTWLTHAATQTLREGWLRGQPAPSHDTETAGKVRKRSVD